MFGLGESIEAIYQHSEENNIPLFVSASRLKSPHINTVNLWPDPVQFAPDSQTDQIDLCKREFGDIVTEFSKMIADYIQFPRSTAFLHCLGCVSAAMTKSFKVEFGLSDMYANIYVVTAQPPSTGKSAINDFCFSPVYEAFKEYNQQNAKERALLEVEIARAERELNKSDNGQAELDEAFDRLEQAQIKLNRVAHIKPTITNTTIEALERETSKQAGMFNIVSDEADSINIVLGAVYSDDSKSSKGNNELILKGWDNGYVGSSRIGRDGLDGKARGTIAVLAQADSVDTILAAGAAGRGVAERFFLLKEDSLLGKRDRDKKTRIDKSVMRQYQSLIANIVKEDELTLSFTAKAEEFLRTYDCRVEKLMSESGPYSHNLLTGFIGKAGKQCRKLAAILHVSQHWIDGGSRSKTIDDNTCIWAISLFDQLAKTYKAASDDLGHVGNNSEIQSINENLTKRAEKGSLKVNITTLRDSIKNKRPFKGSRNLTKKLKDEVIPALEQLNVCVLDAQTIYINPRLK